MAITHDELLAKIDYLQVEGAWDIPVGSERFEMLGKNYRAFRAVVELHKPWLSKHDDLVMCDHCCSEIYPCPTVKVIEKEIG